MIKNKISQEKFLNHFFSGLIFITDQETVPDYIKVAKRLRNYSIIILRDYHLSKEERIKIGQKLRQICQEKRHLFLVARDPEIAQILNADGLHLPEDIAYHIKAKLGNRSQRYLLSCSSHSKKNYHKLRNNFDIFLISQLFPSNSHKNTRFIPFYYLLNMASIYKRAAALGGVNKTTCKRLKNTRFSSYAMISGVKDFIYTEVCFKDN